MATAASAFHVTREQFHLAWDPAIPPIATVASGSTVTFDCLDASGGQLTATSTLDDLTRLDFDRVDQVNGPIAVEGAEPGDTLQIELLDFRRPTGAGPRASRGSACSPTNSPSPRCGSRACPASVTSRSSCRASACRSSRSAARSAWRRRRPALDDPARRPRREHGHAPPHGRSHAVPAGLPRRAPG